MTITLLIFLVLTFCLPSQSQTGLPVINIITENNASITSKEVYTNMTSFVLTDPANPANNLSLVGVADNNGRFNEIRGRGNDSWHNPNSHKKSFRVRFRQNTSLFGLTAARNWVVHAQYRDATLLYNSTAFELGNRFGIPFNKSFNFVDLYMNGTYMGNYLVTEHNQVAPGRVDISETEGWFVELDFNFDEDVQFRSSSYNLPVMVNSPDFTPASIDNPRYAFVRNEVNQFTDLLARHDFPENGYRDLINMRTFVDYMMIQEIVDNGDFSVPGSTFMYKDKNDLINMGPLWDFDCGYGYNYNYEHFNTPARRLLNYRIHPFFARFFDDPVFLVEYRERWREKYDEIISMPDFMDEMAQMLEKSAEANFQAWWYRTFSPWTNTRPYEENDFLESVNKLKNWYMAHVAYMNTDLNKVDVTPRSRTFTYYSIPQTVAVVAYGEMTGLTAILRNGAQSAFEISTALSQIPVGNGDYIATISVKPKRSLNDNTSYNDVLVINGTNQGNNFSFEVPFTYTLNRVTPEYIVPNGLTAAPGTLLHDLEMPEGWRWQEHILTFVGNTLGQRTFKAIYTPEDTYNYNTVRDIDVTITVGGITNNPEQNKTIEPLAKVIDGVLHVTGIISGSTISVYNAAGALIYNRVADSDNVYFPLNAKGLYIVRAGENTIRVVFE